MFESDDTLTSARVLRNLGERRLASFFAAYELRIVSQNTSIRNQIEALSELGQSLPTETRNSRHSAASSFKGVAEARKLTLRAVSRIGARGERSDELRLAATAHEKIARDSLSESPNRSGSAVAVWNLEQANGLLRKIEIVAGVAPDEFRVGLLCSLSFAEIAIGTPSAVDASKRHLDQARYLVDHEYDNLDGLRSRARAGCSHVLEPAQLSSRATCCPRSPYSCRSS